jgi:hypothetical protein
MFQLTQNSLCCTGNFTRRINIFNAYTPDTLFCTSLQVAAEAAKEPKCNSPEGDGGKAPNIV